MKQVRANGRKIQELEHKMKEVKCKFNVGKVFMESETYKVQFDTANTLFKKIHDTMMELM